MKYLILIGCIVCNYTFVYSQSTPFVNFLPDSVPATTNNKNNNNNTGKVSGVNDRYLLAKKTLLSKLRVENLTNWIEVTFQYDANNQLDKVDFKNANGKLETHHLFYDVKKRLYLVVKQMGGRPSAFIEERKFIVINYDSTSRINKVSCYNSDNRLTEYSTYSYEENAVTKTYVMGSGSTRYVTLYSTYPDGNLLKTSSTVGKTDYQAFVSYRDPTSYLPEGYSSMYAGGFEYVWYAMEGNRNLNYKRITESGGRKITSVIKKYKVNANGRVTFVRFAPEEGNIGTDFTYEYKTP